MFETVSTEQALKRGQRMVNVPVSCILIGCLATGITLFILKNGYEILGGVIAIGGFVASWLYWSFAITRWRVWAFDNVRNVHQLKKRAISEKLIWPDGSLWNKTEIWRAADKEKWNNLQVKFETEDIFIDDFSVPNEVLIYFSKSKTFVQLMLAGGMAVLGGYFLCLGKSMAFGGFLAVVGLIMGVTEFLRMRNKKPQIVLNNHGIKTASVQFYPWDDIDGEDVIVKPGRNSTTELVYNHPAGSATIEIDEYDISKEELQKLLRVFRDRNQHSITGKQSILS
jgi:hypothetical protein